MRRIGLFGGTFNPLHFGHINLAFELKEKNHLDEVWFIPAAVSPLRMEEPLLSSEHRLQMLKLALSGIKDFSICDLELKRAAPSYTIDTIREIRNLYPHETFFLLLGEDTLLRFKEWHKSLEIVQNIELLIALRPNSELLKSLPQLDFEEEILAAIRKGLTVTHQMEISATEIRERLRKGLYCRHLMPGKLLDYIYENQLYYTPQ